jgi:hypothetical protein
MGDERGVYRVLVGKPVEREHWGEPGVVARIILRWIFSNWVWECRLDRAF